MKIFFPRTKFYFAFAALIYGLAAFQVQAAQVAQQFVQGTIDLQNDTVTIPLYQGSLRDGRKVWYVITDVSTRSEAQRLGVAYAPELTNAAGAKGTRQASMGTSGALVFSSGTVNFSQDRILVPGMAPNFFPPAKTIPGSVGDQDYSPFVKVETADGLVVYNAPMVAFNVGGDAINFCDGSVDHSLVHDKVVAICPASGLVTVHLSHGFASGHEVVYVSFDSDVALAATMESSTLAPSLTTLRGTGSELDIYAIVNGETGRENIKRQGFNSFLRGDGSPLNVVEAIPSNNTGYSPLWNLNVGVWSNMAIQSGRRSKLTSESEFLSAAMSGDLTGPGGGMFGPVGIFVNCPVVARLAN